MLVLVLSPSFHFTGEINIFMLWIRPIQLVLNTMQSIAHSYPDPHGGIGKRKYNKRLRFKTRTGRAHSPIMVAG